MAHYYSRGSLTLLIVLLFHAGSHYLVPLLRVTHDDFILCPGNALEESVADLYVHDDLFLFKTYTHPLGKYTQSFRYFINDEARSQLYALGGETYARASLYCLQFLEDDKWPDRIMQSPYRWRNNLWDDEDEEERPDSNTEIDNGAKYNWKQDEDSDLCASLYLKDGKWSWKSGDYYASDKDVELYPLVLGYLIYLLPLSGRYEPLIQHCQRHTLSSGSPATYFPNRTKRASQKIDEYLKITKSDGSNRGLVRKWKHTIQDKWSAFRRRQHR